ncbi:GNAT family N-acetyltransferase [Branchiibius hedensis]|uniref:GNAT family N-acetyltransferase n=1 Tax=Branchiibius hedensis TaxID=672460 RepID=UPI001475B955|nr:GNAT family N-acetyltransferase [Branchiibius hedensis]
MGDIRSVASVQELLDLADDPFLRYDIGPDSTTALPAWSCGMASAYLRQPPHRRALSMNLQGPAVDAGPLIEALPDLLARAVAAHPGLAGLTLDAHLVEATRSRLGSAYPMQLMGAWSWLSTHHLVAIETPWYPAELDDLRDAAELIEFYRRANPAAESEPGEGASRYWLGMRDHGRLVGVGAVHLTPAGAPHLTGIAVDPADRGHGLGLAVTAALTNWAIHRYGVATLGVMTANHRAVSLYRGLGYRVAHHWQSFRLLPGAPVATMAEPAAVEILKDA